jgi:hypothetical protein
MMSVEQSVEWDLARETDVLGENMPSDTLSATNPAWPYLGSKQDRRGGKPETNRPIYGTAVLCTWFHWTLNQLCMVHFYGWLVYSCCSHLEHSASVKRFVSLQFLNLRHSVGLLGRVISPSQGRYLTQTQNIHRHPCLEWDLNTRSQRSSERRQFMP